jgi:hypothetical protein
MSKSIIEFCSVMQLLEAVKNGGPQDRYFYATRFGQVRVVAFSVETAICESRGPRPFPRQSALRRPRNFLP